MPRVVELGESTHCSDISLKGRNNLLPSSAQEGEAAQGIVRSRTCSPVVPGGCPPLREVCSPRSGLSYCLFFPVHVRQLMEKTGWNWTVSRTLVEPASPHYHARAPNPVILGYKLGLCSGSAMLWLQTRIIDSVWFIPCVQTPQGKMAVPRSSNIFRAKGMFFAQSSSLEDRPATTSNSTMMSAGLNPEILE